MKKLFLFLILGIFLISSLNLASGIILLPNSTTNRVYNGTLTETKLLLATSSALNANMYARVNRTDANAFQVPGSSSSLDAYVFVNFTVPVGIYEYINFTVIRNTSAASVSGIAFWNFTLGNWSKARNTSSLISSATPTSISYNLTVGDFGDFLSGTALRAMIYDNSTASVVLRVDYIELNVSFTLDTILPDINITFPSNNTNWSSNTINVNYTTSDNLALFNCWYSNDTYLANTSLANCQTNITTVIWSEGQHNVSIWTNDTSGNVNKTDVTFYIDTTPPAIKIIFPLNNTNWSSGSININYTISDAGIGLGYCWWSNNSGHDNNSLSNCANITGKTWIEGKNNITIWVNDTLGNTNYTDISFIFDNISPILNISSPVDNGRYTQQMLVNFTATDSLTSIDALWFYNETENITFIPESLVYQNLTYGNHTFIFYANDSANNLNQTSVTFTVNGPPNITSIIASPDPIKGGNIININISTTDYNNDSLNLYCSEGSITPDATNTNCTGGNTNGKAPTNLTCTYTTIVDSTNHIVYCRTYDGDLYSDAASVSYATDLTYPVTSIVSVAGDTTPSYIDTTNNGVTDIIVSGEANMLCRWSSSDIVYSSMSNDCTISGTEANCSVNNVVSQGLATRYISCKDSLGNEQDTSQNLDIGFYLDYTAPTTSDNSDSNVHAPSYTVTITEADVVDSDPSTKYCTSSSPECDPTTSIDNGGQIVYSSSNRGVNYLRYYSTDFAGNVQTTVNKTININQLPVFTSAVDNATTIRGGTVVNIFTNNSDADSGQNITLYVCNSSGATLSGCSGGNYCNATGTANLSCSFASESDSAPHTWYSYVFDSLGEEATANPLTGSYTTDSTAPVITLANPLNSSTVTQSSVTIIMVVNEGIKEAWYSLDSGAHNITMSNISLYLYTHSNTSIADGIYSLTIWVKGIYDNIGSLTGNSFTVNTASGTDTIAPVITIVSPSNLSYNTASGVLINISADENLNWSGYKINYGTLTNLSSSDSINWNATLSLTDETVYNLTVFANDTSNNQVNKTIIFYTDSLAPRYSSVLATPVSANVSNAVNCSIFWEDAFNITSVKISENSLGSHENHTISFSGTGGIASYLIIGTKLTTPGTYTCMFYATDTAGNVNLTSTTFSVNDVTTPTITVTSPSNSSYNQANIEASIIISEITSWVGYSLDGAANVTMSNISSTAWNKTLTGLSETGHTIQFYANDSSGNMGNSSLIQFSINLGAADTIPPVILINTLSNGSYYTNTTLSLNITINENSSSARYKLNSGSFTVLSNSTMINWNASLSGLGSESTNILEVYANDTSLNTGNTNVTFYVDTDAPRFSDVSAIPASANETQNVICNAYIEDGFNLASVKISENSTVSGVFLNHTIDFFSTGYANYTVLNVQKGSYACMFYATDAAGNVNSTSITFSVSDITAPVITINSPLNQTYATNSILLSITLNENADDADYSFDGGVTNTSLIGSGKSWSKTINLSDGAKRVTFFVIDSSGNIGTNSVDFSTDVSVYDTTPPVITIWSPTNNTYYTNGTSLILNISADEALSWAGYRNNSGTLTDLYSSSTRNWNATIDLEEGNHNITFYANDSSSNKNSANKSIILYVDLNNPSIASFNCTNSVNDSQNIICNGSVSDTIGLNYYIIGNNATGNWINSSQISLNGTSRTLNHTINSGDTSPGNFTVELYLYDLSGRVNTSLYIIKVIDNKKPEIYNITYLPNTTLELDPGVIVNLNATISEDYNISSVSLMLMNITDKIWEYITMNNKSALVEKTNSSIIYSVSFTPQNGTYIFKINATDSAGNWNVSSNYTIVVENDLSFFNSTTIPDIKSFTILQAAENNSLGDLYLNNTGESTLDFNITLTSPSLGTRLSINHTLNQTMTYSVLSGEDINLSIEVNTTALTTNTHKYNVTVSSSAGTTVFSRLLTIQTLAAPYIVTSITKYSSSVTKGQTNIELIASVSNYGTEDATIVTLNWTLPSGFSLTSGNFSRSLSNLPIGSSSTNTITVSISSSAADSLVNISAIATAAGGLSSSDYKEVTIGTPTTIVVTVPGIGGGSTTSGGGAAAGGVSPIIYNKEIEVVRGEENIFNIEVHNPYSNARLEDLTIKLTGFLEQYFSISPSKISSIDYDETKVFTVKLSAPVYKDYEENDLKAVITGKINNGNSTNDYSETQWIKVTIQEVSKEEVQKKSDAAVTAVSEMKKKNFYTVQVERILADADKLMKEKKYKQAEDLFNEVAKTKETAFEAEDLLRRVIESMQKPSRNNLIVGNIIRELGSYDTETPLKNILTGKSVFVSASTEDLVNLGIAAFERGDFISALERAKQARDGLILERKGNFLLFIYLYWYYILLVIFLVSGTGIVGYRKYQKTSITRKIENLNNKEKNLRGLIIKEQGKYFKGDISAGEYKRAMKHHQKELAELKEMRGTLGNTRIKMLKPQQVSQDLKKENKEIEEDIKKLQNQYYKEKKISESEYKSQFQAMNERLAEIEEDKTTLDLLEGENSKDIKIRRIFSSIREVPRNIIGKITGKDKRGIMTLDSSVIGTLKKHAKNKDCKNKWVKLNLKKKK